MVDDPSPLAHEKCKNPGIEDQDFQSITTPKKGGLMLTLKGSSTKTYSPQSRKDRRVFGFSFLLFAETPKSKMISLFVEYNF